MSNIFLSALRKIDYHVNRVIQAFSDHTTEVELGLEYEKRGRIPWSLGYRQARERFIRQTLVDQALMDLFRENRELPKGFGVGFDERCIEYPWLLSKLPPTRERLLDAGSTLNYGSILSHPTLSNKKLYVLTLAPEKDCFWRNGISYIYDDLRDIPLRDDYLDAIACLSTLEHVGLDNRLFTYSERDKRHRQDDFLLAISEMRRILKPMGKLFITVPYGKYFNFGTFQQFDEQLVKETIARFGPGRVEETYFSYSANGWNFSAAPACADAEYVNWVMLPPEERPATFPDHPDRAAAARAVACLLLIKPD
jgi:SAM-dependent methyltransferase